MDEKSVTVGIYVSPAVVTVVFAVFVEVVAQACDDRFKYQYLFGLSISYILWVKGSYASKG